jgi:putative transposase
MPRIARRVTDGGTYHILNRGNGRQRVFHKDADYFAFLALFEQMRDRFAVDLFAYCLMPNHFHLLVKVAQGENLSRGMQWFTTTHVRRYHRHYQSSGHLWQGRYKSFPVLDDDQFLTVARYVEGNPVRAGLVDTATDWVWSSHRERCGLEGNGSLVPMPGALPADWTTFVDTPLTGLELAKVKRNMERQTRQGDRLPH